MADGLIRRHFYLTLEEDALLAAAAKDDGRTKNGFLRAMIRVLKVPAGLERTPAQILEDMRRVFDGHD